MAILLVPRDHALQITVVGDFSAGAQQTAAFKGAKWLGNKRPLGLSS